MTQLRQIGDRSRFAFEIGPPEDPLHPTRGLRQMDIWAAGKWITYFDNAAFASQVALALQHVIRSFSVEGAWSRPYPELSPAENHSRLHDDEELSWSCCRFLDWGPTTDDVYAHLFRENGFAVIPFSFRRPEYPTPEDIDKVFVAELPETELLAVLIEGQRLLANGEL